jgi:excinuclease UvrABC ATPase subunit
MFSYLAKPATANDLEGSTQVAFAGKNINDILTMTIDDAVAFFETKPSK